MTTEAPVAAAQTPAVKTTAPMTVKVQGPKAMPSDFRIAANDVERTDIGGNFHIAGKGFGAEVGTVTLNGRNAYIMLANKAPHLPMWDDENIFGQLPPMSVSGEVIVTTRDGAVQKGFVKLADRFVGGDPRADATDDKAHHPNA